MSRSGPDGHQDIEDAVSALIGTVIVLAITIAGIATALFMGAPILVQMQERAALENVIGQLEEVRAAGNDMFLADEARYPTVAIPSGRLDLEPGGHVLVTVNHDSSEPNCDFRVQDWEGWDAVLTINIVTATPSCHDVSATSANTATTDACGAGVACIYMARVDGATETNLGWTRTAGTSTTYTVSEAISASSDYVFRLKDAGETTLAEAWLMHMDRLAWTTGGVHAAYEGGAVIAQEGSSYYLSAAPAVSEDPHDEPYFLRFTTLQGSTMGSVSGSSSHSLGMVLTSGHVRVDYVETARILRFDFEGRFAEAWCNAFLLRDSLASLPAPPGGTVADYYQEDGNDLSHACSPTSPNADGVRSVRYAEYDAMGDEQAFTFNLSQTVIHASIIL